MRDYLSREVRNIVALGHSGVGKTAVIGSILYFTKAGGRFGVTSEGSSLIDYGPEEIRRDISVYVSLVPIGWRDYEINFIDTPEYADLIHGAGTGIMVGGSALIVVNTKDAIQPGTIRAWEVVQKRSIPIIFFVNRLDGDNTFLDQTYSVLRETFGRSVIPFKVPIMENGKTVGSMNILRDKAWYFEGSLANPNKAQPVSENMAGIVTEYKSQIAEAIAMSDNKLTEKHFSGEEFSEAGLTRGIRLGMRNGEIRPVLSRSVARNVGTKRLMDLIVKYFPTYGEAESIMINDAETREPVMLETNEEGTLCAQVFKTVIDPFVGRISYIKVLVGVMSSNSIVYNATKDQVEKISTIFIVKGKHQTAVEKLLTGDIGTVVELQAVQTNDTLCEKGKHYLVEPIQSSEPMLDVAIFPNSKNDGDKMNSALARMVEEDPTLRLENNKETRQTILYGIGDQRIDVVLDRLKNKRKVEVRLETPRVPYHGTIRKMAVGKGRHKKQSSGHGQLGHVFVEFAPNPDEKEVVFEGRVFGGAVPRQYFPTMETGLRGCMQHGLLAGHKIVNVEATLLDGKYHDVDSNKMAFKLATRLSYKAGIPKAKPVLLEPIVNITVKVPGEFTGTIIGGFSKRHGAIMGMDVINGYQEITVQIPLAEVQRYPIELRAMTQGRGVCTQGFDRYEPVPSNVADDIIAQRKKEEGE